MEGGKGGLWVRVSVRSLAWRVYAREGSCHIEGCGGVFFLRRSNAPSITAKAPPSSCFILCCMAAGFVLSTDFLCLPMLPRAVATHGAGTLTQESTRFGT